MGSFICKLILLYSISTFVVLGIAKVYDDYDNRGVIERWLSGG